MYNVLHGCGCLVNLSVGIYFLFLDMVDVNKKRMTQAIVTAW